MTNIKVTADKAAGKGQASGRQGAAVIRTKEDKNIKEEKESASPLPPWAAAKGWTLEVWCEAFGGNMKEIKNTDTREINAIMAATPGWKKFANATYMGCYGTQRGFKRK